MSKLGELLKNKRESLSLSITKISDDTRISDETLALLEEGDFKSLPSYIHSLNFIKQYAAYLHLEEDKVMQLFNEECSKSDYEREITYVSSPVTEEVSVKVGYSKYVILLVIITTIAIVASFVYVSMNKNQAKKENSVQVDDKPVTLPTETKEEAEEKDVPIVTDDKDAPAENIIEEKAATPEVKQPVTAEEKPVVKAEEKPVIKEEPAVVLKKAVMIFSDACWVHIKIDDSNEMDFIAQKGTTREIEFEEKFLLDLGNAAVVSIEYNGNTINGLGAYKKPMKNLEFTISGSNLVYKKIN